MIGLSMPRDAAVETVGREFAGHVYAGAGTGRWLTGKVIAFIESPTLLIEDEAGQKVAYAITAIKDWAVSEDNYAHR